MTKVRDPVCGMDVDTETAISRKIGDRTYYFCSQQCADVYTAPERELKAMQRRVTVTLNRRSSSPWTACGHAFRSFGGGYVF